MKIPPKLNPAAPSAAPAVEAKPRPTTDRGDRVVSGGAAVDLLKPPEFEPLAKLPPVKTRPPEEVPTAMAVLQGWWSQVADFFSGSTATREVNRGKKLLSEVNAFAPKMAALSDAELAGQTKALKAQLGAATSKQHAAVDAARETLAAATMETREAATKSLREAERALAKAEKKALDKLLPEAFATVREATKRATGMFQYDVQVLAGALMHQGMVAEMYTGEGKTLAATMPAYLNALAGHGFHVVTVNDYLARRDAEEMGEVYRYLGMSVGVLQNNHEQFVIAPRKAGEAEDAAKPKTVSRQDAYKADITYGTASEFAFDHLRDNGVRDPTQRVQRPLYGVLLDEIDSLLLDEARTPHIIAGQGEKPEIELFAKFRDIVAKLDWKTDVEWDLEEHWVSLTDKGQKAVHDALGIDNIYAEQHLDNVYFLQNALKARFLLRKDEHYTVLDGEIRTIGHSGHAMIGRRFTRGLHQALEVKEGLEVRPENVTQASITMRDFLAQYQRASGMTGTALSAKDVFREIYGLDVARVPTRKPLIRVDHPDKIFPTQAAKLEQFIKDVKAAHSTGRPILVGVEWTSTAEALGAMLKAEGLDVNVLGAKSDRAEAAIIAGAGRLGAITVATTRGGRGVDIKLGGSPKVVAEEIAEEKKIPLAEAKALAGEITADEKAQVLELGGLLVMSFEHLDSRRRDDQLRGRAGRQGDPGATVFYTSIEDAVYDGLKEVEPMREGKAKFDELKARKHTEGALTRSENKVNDVLTTSLPYDDTANLFRHKFYDLRRAVLEVTDARPLIRNSIDLCLENIFLEFGSSGKHKLSGEDAQNLYRALARVLPLPEGQPPPKWTGMPVAEVSADIEKLVGALLAKRDEAVGEEFSRLIERDVALRALDSAWSGFLDDIQDLRGGIHLRSFAQKDPKIEFMRETALLYGQTLETARSLITQDLLQKIPKKIEAPAPTPPPPTAQHD